MRSVHNLVREMLPEGAAGGGSRHRAILPTRRRCEVGVGVRFVDVSARRSGAFWSEGSSWHDVRFTLPAGSLVEAGRQRADRGWEVVPGIMCRMITVCDISALARWAEVGLLDRLGSPCEPPPSGGWSLPHAALLSGIDLRGARLEAVPERPLHILVSSPEGRIRSRRLRSHVWSTELPKDALYQLTDEVLIASPSFCLQQMAARSSVAYGAAVGTEICGGYARSPRAPHGFYKRPPLARADELVARFEDEHGYGARRAREALAYVVEGSRSPMETVVVLLFTLPVELGGCGLPRPVLNCRIEIPPSLQLALGKPYLTVDLCWPEWRIILEYDSYLWHGGREQQDADNPRNEGLRDLGWMVRSVTAGMLGNDGVLAELVSKVMARAGRAVPDDEEFRLRQHALVRELLAL